ncbi:hypothetical protein CCHL11_08272 [Colletotrichum chlorophyti]|uniref:LysM domain-containing protein n=1 Tax=Colletotrichum chlorophyti TaxID=708187 RepID=A0A1Q8RND5_9PEZI|nr:hypothetical protein CCHL11_08272 [Colletotrichum chlorophyti]
MRSVIPFALAALAGLAEATRGCRHDRKHPGLGWYWIVKGDTLDPIASDFGTTSDHLVALNPHVIHNKDSIPAWTTIVVPCA